MPKKSKGGTKKGGKKEDAEEGVGGKGATSSAESPAVVREAQAWASKQWELAREAAEQKVAALEAQAADMRAAAVPASQRTSLEEYRERRATGLARAKAITQSLAAQEGGLSIPLLLLTKPDSNENRRILGYPPKVGGPSEFEEEQRRRSKEAEPDERSVQEIVDAMEAEGRGQSPLATGALPTVAWPNSARIPLPPDFENDQGRHSRDTARNYTLSAAESAP